jgi:N-[(2S)-2-amino-2-carboxyethyl]-L-glutamate dehydrogenase
VLAARAGMGSTANPSVALVGTGLISRYLYVFLLASGWDPETITLYDAIDAEAERFKTLWVDASRHRRVVVAKDIEAAIRSSELVCLTTTAGKPHIQNPAWLSHNPLVLNVSLRDIAPEIILASYNVVDDIEHVMSAETSVHLAEKGSGHRDFVNATIAELLLGVKTVPRSRPVIVSPFGLGILDVAVGHCIFGKALQSGRVLPINDFFFDMWR